MCGPAAIPLATLAITALSTGASLYAQNQQMKAQEAYNDQEYQNQMTAYRDNLEATNNANAQARAAAIQEEGANNLQARKAMATARAAAGESGVEGSSVDALLMDLAGQRAQYNQSVEANYETQVSNNNIQLRNSLAGTRSAINSLRTPQAPDYIGATLRIAGAGIGAYGQYQQNLKQPNGT